MAIVTTVAWEAPELSDRLVLLRELVIPGDAAGDRRIVPTNPLRLFTVTVDVAEFPAISVKEIGDAEIEKLGRGAVYTVIDFE